MTKLQKARASGRSAIRMVFLFSVFVNLLMLTGPLFMLQVYDRVLGSGSEETLLALFILVLSLYAMMAILDFARGRILARFGSQFQYDLDPDVFRQTIDEAVDPKQRARPAKGLQDLETLRQLSVSPALLAICDLPWAPLYLGLIFVFHPLLGWLAVAGSLILIALACANHFLSREKTKTSQQASAVATAFSEDVRANSELVKTQAMGSATLARWLKLRFQSVEQTLGASDTTGLFTAVTKAFRLFLQSAMLAGGAYLVLRGELTAGAMIAGSILLGRALAPIEQSVGSWALIQRSMLAWTNLGEALKGSKETAAKTQLPRPEAKLIVRNLTLAVHGRKHPVLSQINFALSPGEVVGIIGKSGAGKSSFARVILSLVRPTSGEVLFGGAQIAQYDEDTFGTAIGYLPQNVSMFPATIAENIARMAEVPDDDAVVNAAKRAHVHELITSLPEGYNTQLGRNDTVLSGGQVQRVALARALYTDPVLLVLDEPNSALDASGTEALNRCIRDYKAQGRIVILMTHRPMAIAECDRLIVLENGKIAADGPKDDVVKAMLKNSGEIQRTIGKKATA